MKKTLALLLAVSMLFALCACGGSSAPSATMPEPSPEPTAEPTPEPTPEHTPEPTPEPLEVSDFYPILNDSYCGVPVPTPRGDKCLVRIVTKDGSAPLCIVTDLNYDEAGTLMSTNSFFDTAGEYLADLALQDPVVDKTFDDEGRVTGIMTSFGNDAEVVYGEDPTVITMRRLQEGGNPYEREIRLDEKPIPDWIRKTPEEFETFADFILNEDGLTEQITNRKSGSTQSYSYKAENYDDGSLKAVQRRIGSGKLPLMEFDPDGYLTFFVKGNLYNISILYIYE